MDRLKTMNGSRKRKLFQDFIYESENDPSKFIESEERSPLKRKLKLRPSTSSTSKNDWQRFMDGFDSTPRLFDQKKHTEQKPEKRKKGCVSADVMKAYALSSQKQDSQHNDDIDGPVKHSTNSQQEESLKINDWSSDNDDDNPCMSRSPSPVFTTSSASPVIDRCTGDSSVIDRSADDCQSPTFGKSQKLLSTYVEDYLEESKTKVVVNDTTVIQQPLEQIEFSSQLNVSISNYASSDEERQSSDGDETSQQISGNCVSPVPIDSPVPSANTEKGTGIKLSDWVKCIDVVTPPKDDECGGDDDGNLGDSSKKSRKKKHKQF